MKKVKQTDKKVRNKEEYFQTCAVIILACCCAFYIRKCLALKKQVNRFNAEVKKKFWKEILTVEEVLESLKKSFAVETEGKTLIDFYFNQKNIGKQGYSEDHKTKIINEPIKKLENWNINNCGSYTHCVLKNLSAKEMRIPNAFNSQGEKVEQIFINVWIDHDVKRYTYLPMGSPEYVYGILNDPKHRWNFSFTIARLDKCLPPLKYIKGLVNHTALALGYINNKFSPAYVANMGKALETRWKMKNDKRFQALKKESDKLITLHAQSRNKMFFYMAAMALVMVIFPLKQAESRIKRFASFLYAYHVFAKERRNNLKAQKKFDKANKKLEKAKKKEEQEFLLRQKEKQEEENRKNQLYIKQQQERKNTILNLINTIFDESRDEKNPQIIPLDHLSKKRLVQLFDKVRVACPLPRTPAEMQQEKEDLDSIDKSRTSIVQKIENYEHVKTIENLTNILNQLPNSEEKDNFKQRITTLRDKITKKS